MKVLQSSVSRMMSPKVSGAELDHVTVSPPAGSTGEEQGVGATGVGPETGLGNGPAPAPASGPSLRVD